MNLKNNPIPNNVANKLLRLTDNTTVNRVKRYYYDADKIRTILGEVLIKYCLVKNFGIELYRATIYRTRMGKPVYAEKMLILVYLTKRILWFVQFLN